MLRRRFADAGWEVPAILDSMAEARTFSFDCVRPEAGRVRCSAVRGCRVVMFEDVVGEQSGDEFAAAGDEVGRTGGLDDDGDLVVAERGGVVAFTTGTSCVAADRSAVRRRRRRLQGQATRPDELVDTALDSPPT